MLFQPFSPPENLVHPSKSKCVLKGIEGIEKQCRDSLQQQAAAAAAMSVCAACACTHNHAAAYGCPGADGLQILIVLPAPALAPWRHLPLH